MPAHFIPSVLKAEPGAVLGLSTRLLASLCFMAALTGCGKEAATEKAPTPARYLMQYPEQGPIATCVLYAEHLTNESENPLPDGGFHARYEGTLNDATVHVAIAITQTPDPNWSHIHDSNPEATRVVHAQDVAWQLTRTTVEVTDENSEQDTAVESVWVADAPFQQMHVHLEASGHYSREQCIKTLKEITFHDWATHVNTTVRPTN